MLKFDISNIELTNSLFIVIRLRDNISLRRHYWRRRATERDSYRATTAVPLTCICNLIGSAAPISRLKGQARYTVNLFKLRIPTRI